MSKHFLHLNLIRSSKLSPQSSPPCLSTSHQVRPKTTGEEEQTFPSDLFSLFYMAKKSVVEKRVSIGWKKNFYGTIFHRPRVRSLFSFSCTFALRCMQLPQQQSQENGKLFFSRFLVRLRGEPSAWSNSLRF